MSIATVMGPTPPGTGVIHAARSRAAARRARNWAESDRIRDQLAVEGVVLEDKPGGQTAWRRA